MQTHIVYRNIKFSTGGEVDVVNITPLVEEATRDSGLEGGIVTVFVPGATGAVTTTEFEPGCVEDLKNWFNEHVPVSSGRGHQKYEGDGNGHSHLRASLVGPSLVVPFSSGSLMLGTWQSVVFIDFDVRHRRRELVLQFIGCGAGFPACQSTGSKACPTDA